GYGLLAGMESPLLAESFRTLRTMVDLAIPAEQSAALLVTSSVPHEGKSFVASHLAAAFAQSGDRVLLIDGDLRRVKTRRQRARSAQRGLSEFLARASRPEDVLD